MQDHELLRLFERWDRLRDEANMLSDSNKDDSIIREEVTCVHKAIQEELVRRGFEPTTENFGGVWLDLKIKYS